MNQNSIWQTDKFECPHCHAISAFDCIFSTRGEFEGVFYPFSVWQCHNCDRAIFITHQPGEEFVTRTHRRIESSFPTKQPKVDHRVPEGIAADFTEAAKDYSIGSFKSSAVMARRTIQKMCLNLGASKGKKLHEQIEQLKSGGKLHPDLADIATEIRFLGNDGAHPEDDGLDDIGPEDAKEILDFTGELLDDLYVRPQKVAAMKSRRETKSA